MYLSRKGQKPEAGGVAGLVLLIAVFIILYTLILPPCDKCKLLNQGSCSDVCEGEIEAQILLNERPGNIGEILDDNVEHTLEPVNLVIRDESEVRTLSNSLEVRNGLFGESDEELNFRVDDLENLEKLSLSFATIKTKGNLIISLNGKQIYNNDVAVNRIQVVDLPIDFLERDNELKFRVSPPGLAFWSSNVYSLKDINLVEEFELIHSSDVLTFSVSSSELDSITDSDLDFFVFCKGSPGGSNILKVHLNGNLIFSELISCGTDEFSEDIDEDHFVSGVNELEFSVTGGEYLISDIEITNKISGEVFPSYIFYIRREVFEDADRFYLDLEMRSGVNKRADIIINEDTIRLNTDSSFKEFDITHLVKRGNNFIEIRPDNEFRVDKLIIGYE